jgi:hypothetical protein
MSSEILICHRCKSEYEVYLGDKWAINDGQIVAQTSCKCKKEIIKIGGLKVLDYAIKQLGEILNEKSKSSSSKVSRKP